MPFLPPSLPPSVQTYFFGVSLHVHLNHHGQAIDLAAVGLHKLAVGELFLQGREGGRERGWVGGWEGGWVGGCVGG